MNQPSFRQVGFAVLVLALVAGIVPAAAQYDIEPISPQCRAYNSRFDVPNGPLDLGTIYTVILAPESGVSACGVPAYADGVSIVVTIVGAVGPGDLSVFPAGGAVPSGTPPLNSLRFEGIDDAGEGKNRNKNFIVPLGSVPGEGSGVDFAANRLDAGNGKYQLVIDVNGYYINTVIQDDAATVAEDDPATAIDVLANDTDPDDPLLIASATDPANGTVVLTGGSPGAHTGLTYQPDADYCNDPPGTTLDTFTYTVTSTGVSATVEVTVTCVDDDPVAVDDTATVAEDAVATTINVLANDTDVDGGPMTIASATDPANGAVVVAGDNLSLTYEPDPDYCNDPPGTTLDTFTYTLSPGGDTATVSVTVACVAGDPVAVDDTATVAEDSGATTINVLANDSDDEGDPFTIASASDPANGTVVIAGDNLSLTYQPDPNYCNTPPGTTLDTFTYTLTPGGDTATVSVTVTCTNDDPVAVDDAATVAEDAAATTINVLANDSDAESDAFTITASSDPANGTVVIAGDNLSLTYQPDPDYCNTPPGTTLDTFTYTLTPGGDTATVTVTVNCVEDDPVAVADAATVAEDSGATTIPVLANDTDVDGGTKTIASATDPANGTVAIAGDNLSLTYTPDPNYCNTPPGTTLDTFNYTLSPGGSSATVTVTVTCLDDNPVAVADAATVAEDSGATTILVLANDTDVDGGAKTIASATDPANGTVAIAGDNLSLTYTPDPNYCNTPPGTTLDTFNYTLSPGGSSTTVTVTVTCVEDNPVAVADAATVAEDSGATSINVLANDTDPDGGTNTIASATDPANGTVAIAGDNLSLTYTPDPNYCNTPPGTTLDTFNYTLSPGGSSTTVTVTVTCIDDLPVAVADGATVLEDAAATAINVLANDTDIDGGPKTISSATDPANGTVLLTGGSPGAHTGLTYQPDPNYCNNPPGTTLDTFNYTLNGGSFATVTVTVTCVNDAPVLGDATIEYTTIGNTQLRAGEAATGASVFHRSDNQDVAEKSSPTDIDGPAPPFTYSLGTAPANGQATVNGDGTFTYEPNPGFAGPTDTFTVNVSDGGVPAGIAVVQVTVTISEMVWYVHDVTGANNPAAGDDGRSTNAFEILQDAINAAGPDDYVFVFRGNTGTTPHGPATLTNKDGLKLHGQGIGLTLPVLGTVIPAGGEPNEAVIQNTAATAGEDNALQVTINAGTVDNVEIRGFAITSTDNAIDVTVTGAATAGVRISENEIGTTAAEGIDVNHGSTSAASAIAVHDNVLLTAGNAIDIARTNGTLKISAFDDNVISGNTAGSGIVLTGSISFDSNPGTGALDGVSGGTTVIGASDNPVTGSGVVMSSVTGSLNFTDLDIYAGGSGLVVSGTGVAVTNLQVTPASPDGIGTAVIDADNGPAVDVANATIDLRLADMDSTTAGSGLSLNTVAGQFRAPSGSSIIKSSGGGTAFSVASSSATVNYAGTLNVTSGAGVALTGNSGTTNFSGLLTLNTGSSPAFAATGGGTVTATDLASTLATTTATALNVANTTIGAGGLKFRSIASNGGSNSGIVLNNTGNLGGLTVSGTGSAGSGGTIQNKTVDGISLINTRGVSLSHMVIDNNDGSGIFGDDVTNFSIAGSSVINNGDTQNGSEANLRFNELLGTSSIANTTITGSSEDNIRLTPTSGVLTNLTISNSVIGPCAAPVACNGFTLIATGTADATVTVTGSTFQNNKSSAFLTTGDNTAKQTISISTSTFQDNNVGVDLAHGGSGDFNFNISNNTSFLRHASDAIRAGTADSTTNAMQVVGTISGNTIGNGTLDSGSRDAQGIDIDMRGDADAIVSITGNTVSNTDIEGIRVQGRLDDQDGPDAEKGRLDLTLRNNVINTPDDNSAFPFGSLYGVLIEARNTYTFCMDIANNDSSSVGSFEHFRARQRDSSVFLLERLTDGDGTPNEVINVVATVESHLASQNIAGSTADATLVSGFTEAANGTCRKP